MTFAQVGLGISALLNHVPVSLGSLHQANALNLFTVVVGLMHVLRRPRAGGLPAFRMLSRRAKGRVDGCQNGDQTRGQGQGEAQVIGVRTILYAILFKPTDVLFTTHVRREVTAELAGTPWTRRRVASSSRRLRILLWLGPSRCRA